MANLKKQNPDANWKNLITGVVILVLVALFSVWYFSNDTSPGGSADIVPVTGEQIEELVGTNGEETGNGAVEEEQVQVQINEQEVVTTEEGRMAAVLAGESLWKVAERVCGKGEAYVYLAAANGYTVNWAPIKVGQMLKVDCGPTE